MSIRKRFALRQDAPSNSKTKTKLPPQPKARNVAPMEVDHFRPKRCHKCRKLGHFAKDCRVKNVQAINAPFSDQTSGRFRKPFSGRCWGCGEIGHIKRNCPRLGNDSGVQGN